MIEIRPITSREQWLQWRTQALTASDIGAVARVDPYRSALQVYAEKVEFIPVPENALMRRGRMMEPTAVEYLRDYHPEWTVDRPNAFYVDTEAKVGCTPDALITDEDGKLVNCQIKVIAKPVFDRWEGSPPAGYLLQTACENMLLDADSGMLAVLWFSNYDCDLVEFNVPRHPGAEARILDLVHDFWANIAAGQYPAPDYERDAEIIAHLHPPRKEVPVPLDLSPDNRIYAVLEDRERAKNEIKTAEATVRALDAEIKHKLHGAELAVADGWKISNTTIEREEHIVKASKYQRLLVSRVEAAA